MIPGNRPDTGRSLSMGERLVRFLVRERAAGRDGVAEIHSFPLAERVDRGWCLAGLRVLGRENGGSRIVLACPENLSRFRRGDKLNLGYGADPSLGLSVVYVGFDPLSRALRLDLDPFGPPGARWDDLDLGRSLAADRTSSDFIDVALRAVQSAYAGTDARALRVRSILEGMARQSVDAAEWEDAMRLVPPLALDGSQAEAFARSHAMRPFHLVQGPPGSGKTWLIARLLAVWLGRGERVLVTAQTHRAVNNVLCKLADIAPGLETIKIGEAHNAEDLPSSVARVRRVADMRPPAPGRGQAVGGTVFALARLWDEAPFHRVVFDEAAQILVPLALCGMLAGERYLFVGDHRQLGPIVSGEHDDPIAGLSIFEHLAERHEVTRLDRTYRMNEGVNAFPSRRFYDGALRPSPEAAARKFPLVRSGPFDALLDPDTPAVIAAIAHEGHRMRARAEARLAADLVEEILVRQRLAPSEVAVLTPFRAQIREIRNLLDPRLGAGAEAREALVVDTVERMQGQEREVVIVSLACSEPEYAAREAAFFFSPGRLNVMLTRARTKLIVLASPYLFRALPSDLDTLRRASLFARLWRELPKVDLTARYLGSEPTCDSP